MIGGAAAILLFALIAPIEAMIRGTAGAEQFAALFGSITMGSTGYVVILLQIVLIAAVAAEIVAPHRQSDHRIDLTDTMLQHTGFQAMLGRD